MALSPQAIVDNTFAQALDIHGAYKGNWEYVRDNPMIPDGGKDFKRGELRDKALKDAKALQQRVAAAGRAGRVQLVQARDAARPEIDPATHERRARQLSYLLDKGVSVEAIISDYGNDPAMLRVMQEELPILARGQNPDDSKAGEAAAFQMEQNASDVYGDDYREADDAIQEFDKLHDRATLAAGMTVNHFQDNPDGEFLIPGPAEGEVIER